MRPDLDELDEEIQGHIALSIRERIERGEDPEAARLAALKKIQQSPPDAGLHSTRLAASLVR